VYLLVIYTHTHVNSTNIYIRTRPRQDTHAYETQTYNQNSRVWKSPEELENQSDNIKYVRLPHAVAHMNEHICIYIYVYIYICMYICIYNDHYCCLETNHDVTCRDNGTRFAPEREQSIDREGDAAPRYRRPLRFPLTRQYRSNISRRTEVYGSRKRRESMTQTTTTFFAGMSERIQKSMDRGDTVPRYRRPLLFPLTCQHRRNITKGRSLWIEEATQLHDADDHYCFRRPTNKNTEVYGSGRRGSTMQTTTAVSADVSSQTQHHEG